MKTGSKKKDIREMHPTRIRIIEDKKSPGVISPETFLHTDTVASGTEPKCMAIHVPCATMCPSLSHTAAETSMPSRRIGEYAVRTMVSVISSTMMFKGGPPTAQELKGDGVNRRHSASPTAINMLPLLSTETVHEGGTTTVVSYSSTIIGP